MTQVQNSEGLWGMLSEQSLEAHCSVKCPGAYTLISSPFNIFLTPTSNSDPSQVNNCLYQHVNVICSSG